jgi:hypothetical protein
VKPIKVLVALAVVTPNVVVVNGKASPLLAEQAVVVIEPSAAAERQPEEPPRLETMSPVVEATSVTVSDSVEIEIPLEIVRSS